MPDRGRRPLARDDDGRRDAPGRRDGRRGFEGEGPAQRAEGSRRVWPVARIAPRLGMGRLGDGVGTLTGVAAGTSEAHRSIAPPTWDLTDPRLSGSVRLMASAAGSPVPAAFVRPGQAFHMAMFG